MESTLGLLLDTRLVRGRLGFEPRESGFHSQDVALPCCVGGRAGTQSNGKWLLLGEVRAGFREEGLLKSESQESFGR